MFSHMLHTAAIDNNKLQVIMKAI